MLFCDLILLTLAALQASECIAFAPPGAFRSPPRISCTRRYNWFENLFPELNDPEAGADRLKKFPEQYTATYDMSTEVVPSDGPDAKIVRSLLKQTQLEKRELQLVFDANQHGWNPQAFHQRVDGKGGAIVLANGNTFDGPIIVGEIGRAHV